MYSIILVGIGANLPASDGGVAAETCRRAADAVGALPRLTVRAVSPWYESDPIPPSDQPPFVNGVLLLAGAPDPAALLADLLAIEARFGRRRPAPPNAARPLDLDIIDIGGLVRTAPDPVLPHPRAHERAFVLRPIADLLPAWTHPTLGRTALDMLAMLPPQGLRRL